MYYQLRVFIFIIDFVFLSLVHLGSLQVFLVTIPILGECSQCSTESANLKIKIRLREQILPKTKILVSHGNGDKETQNK